MTSARGRSARLVGVGVVAVLTVPFLAVLALRVGRPVVFVQDLAVIALRARDAASGHWVLLGPWSRQGFAHPGPLFYWLLAVPSALTGGRHWGLIAGSAVLHLVAIVSIGALAWRRGGAALTVLVGAAVGASYLTVGAWGLIAPWNIWVAFPYFLLFLLLAWSVAIGDVRLLPWFVLVGTFLVQTHLGYIPLVAVASVWAAVRGWFALRSRPHVSLTGPIVASALLLLVCWLPVVIDELFVTHNLNALGHYLLNTPEQKAGLASAAGWMADEFRILPTWLGGTPRAVEFTGWAKTASLLWLLVPVALLAAGWWAMLRRPDRDRRALLELATIMPFVGLFAMAGVTGDRFDYLFSWRVTIALFLVAAVVWVLVPLLPRRDVWRRVLLGLGMAAALAASVVLTVRVIDFPSRLGHDDRLIAGLVSSAERHVPRGPLWVRAIVDEHLGVAATLIERLDAHGRDVRVEEGTAFKYGQDRATPIHRGDPIWIAGESGQVSARLTAIPGVHVVAQNTPLPAADQARLDRLQRSMQQRLHRRHLDRFVPLLDSPLFAYVVRDVHGLDRRAADEISRLAGRVERRAPCHCVIVEAAWSHRLHRALDALEAGRR